MRVTFLDANTFGTDVDLKAGLSPLGEITVFDSTDSSTLRERIADCDVLMTNKVRLCGEDLAFAKNLKLICVSATGYDPIDVEYCKSRKIGVCNVVGYSTDSVAQLTLSLALALYTRIFEFADFTASGEYTRRGIANFILPYHELAGKTWGIVGLGNIGRKVQGVAKALGCRVIYTKRTPTADPDCVLLDKLCKEADIISVHTPLSEQTRGMIGEKEIALMKKSAILINVARGAVTDEKALAKAVLDGRIAGLGVDVYSEEPFAKTHPFYALLGCKNVIFTPHMAWASVEARYRCIDEMVKNAQAFFAGEIRNRVDL